MSTIKPTLSTSVNANGEVDLMNFTQGIELDKPLAICEVRVQKAWVRALGRARLLSPVELWDLETALTEAETLFKDGTFPWKVEDEDVHMNLERFLTEKLGDLGKKIHLGRSRNDLIATTLRLFVESNVNELSELTGHLITCLCARAKKDIDIIVPGLTHLQFGQPIRLAQIYTAQAWMFHRDVVRLQQSKEMAMLSMPLGSAALSGTTLNIDLRAMAEDLGFQLPPLNSCDSVGDRDFIQQTLQTYAMLATHLSRMCEDYIVWTSAPFSWVSLPKEWSTGSSIMPNKRNPDVAELIRAKSAQVIGDANSAQILLKGLATSYSSDLHELKRIYLSALSTLKECLFIFPKFIAGLEPNPSAIQSHLNKGHILATEIANELTNRGLSFRAAYQVVASLVETANAKDVPVHMLQPQEWQKIAPQLDEIFMSQLSCESAVELRANQGGTSKASVLTQIDQLLAIL